MSKSTSTSRRSSPARLAAMVVLVAAAPNLPAAPITDLFSSGLDATGTPLAAQKTDPHYVIVQVPDPTDPALEPIATNAPASTLKAGFPVGPWLAESALSRWIAPQADQSTGSAPGDYIYRTKFNLTGFDPSTARIVGRWTSDNTGKDILLNDTPLGISQGGAFAGFYDFEITTGFVAGTNVLDFVINNAPPGVNPTGIRIEIVRATAEKPGDPPAFLVQPKPALALVGDALALSVEVDGTRPLSFRWQKNGIDVAGATEATYSIPSAALDQAGDYTVVVSNSAGTKTSSAAKVRILEPIPGVFATGVDAAGNALDDYATDTHYRLTVNPDNSTITEPTVADSTLFPIVAGPWIANTATSKWIGPTGETSGAAAGDYTYRVSFNLPAEFDPATAVLFGAWATDNDGLDIVVNGAGTGNANTVQFASLTPFEITRGLVAGANTVEFKLNNAALGYTGLRVDPLRVGALRGTGCKLRIAAPPSGATVFAGATVGLKVVADGCGTLRYQWKRDSQDLIGKTTDSLDLGAVTGAQAGAYSVTVTDSSGASLTSDPARLVVLDPISGVFGTGVDDTGKPLDDGLTDPHYTLIVNPQDTNSVVALVEDSTGFPIVSGPWIANTETSKWIGPTPNTVAAPGDYTYRTVFSIPTEFDLATIRLQGSWTSDNNAPDVVLNGKSTGITGTGDFANLSAFVITNGFKSGTNTLEFQVSNPGTEANPTGLRVQGLRADGVKGSGSSAPSLSVARSGADLRVTWPASVSGFKLASTPTLVPATWTEVNAPVKVEGDRNVVVITPSATAAFYRLQP